jgi:hypothetical protein
VVGASLSWESLKRLAQLARDIESVIEPIERVTIGRPWRTQEEAVEIWCPPSRVAGNTRDFAFNRYSEGTTPPLGAMCIGAKCAWWEVNLAVPNGIGRCSAKS